MGKLRLEPLAGSARLRVSGRPIDLVSLKRISLRSRSLRRSGLHPTSNSLAKASRGITGIALVVWLSALACAPEPDDSALATDVSEARQRRTACAAVPAVGDACALLSSVHARLGIPTDGDLADDFWMEKESYLLSYNPEKNLANWVIWRLDANDMGGADRSNRFRIDQSLPSSFLRVRTDDYRLTGYDRGHLCPSKERTRTPEENDSTFLMTNIHPQVPELNMGPWKALEEYEQSRAMRENEGLYIVAGPVFGRGTSFIGRGVAVPIASFRIVVPIPHGESLSELSEDNDVIAVLMPNDAAVAGHAWRDYLVTVDEIEARTGYDFLSELPNALEATLESKLFGGDLR